ncbi:MAG TPA: DUF87 domain-containing protein [Glycomyces sp.]|nr:DUF87 domain-containing protein [Glycomyces sp.]
MTLFDHANVIGTFRGFAESGMEFHADLVFPHHDNFQTMAMHGQFVLVQLEHEREAILGRITSVSSQGRLVSPSGEDYATRAARDRRAIPDELRERYLKYKVDIRILGVLRETDGNHVFIPSHRRLPQVGAQVAQLSDDLLKEITSATMSGDGIVPLGFLAFGEFVYAGEDTRVGEDTSWMMVQHPTIMPTFQIEKLVARRSFVFARAGFGKSNLVKLLFSALYEGKPTVDRRGGQTAPVGTVIFDPDGEYFWPDPKGRPGLCDVPHLEDKLAVFTNRQGPSEFYQSFVVDGVKLNIKELAAPHILGIALPPEKQDQQNVAKLKSLTGHQWDAMVDLIYAEKYGADREQVAELLSLEVGNDDAQLNAAVANMDRVVRALHDPESQMLGALKHALSEGKLCIVDISQMRGAQGLHLAGIILSDIFEHNQTQFTEADPKTIPTIAVIEEAQSVLGGSRHDEDGPFVSWVKEGRKYDLGAFLITQQPGSLPQELVSQGDNFFVFHLLSAGDLRTLQKANAHFSEDLLATLLNEPLVGHGVFWSSAPGTEQGARPYPIPVRVLSFDAESYPMLDPEYDRDAPTGTFAVATRALFQESRAEARTAAEQLSAETGHGHTESGAAADYRAAAIKYLKDTQKFWQAVETEQGIRWGEIQGILKKKAPPAEADPKQWAYDQVRYALTQLLGKQYEDWETVRGPNKSGTKTVVWVRKKGRRS